MKTTSFLLVFAVVLSCCRAQTGAEPEEAGGEGEEPVELFTTPRTKMAAAASDFGYNLFRALAAQQPDANVFLAPAAVTAAISQLSLGASPQAQRQLLWVLRFHGLQNPELHQSVRELLGAVGGGGKGLSLAARLYAARRLRLKQDFFSLVERQYGVRPKALMGGARDLKEVNDWVSQQTGSRVQQVLTAPLPRGGGVSAITAAHFRGRWVTRFSRSGAMEDFQVEGAAPVRVPMMQQDNYAVKMGADSDLNCLIAQIQMEENVSAFFFLPDAVSANMSLLEESLTAEFVQDLSMTLLPAQVRLSLPELRISFSTDLLPLLGDLGLSDWLQNPDLEKISAQPAKLSSLNHKAVLELAPEGGQYPGGGGGGGGGGAGPSHLSYRVDRPFLFLIRDESSGALLFIGRVLNPKGLTA
ncbi:pigment epithelium-derived factor isoform 1-T1 [Menidia menidia]